MNKKLLFLFLYGCCGLSAALAQNLTNGDFEDWGDQSVDIYRRATFGFKPGTCENVESAYSLFQTFEAEDRPLGFKVFDDFFVTNPPSSVTQATDAADVFEGNSAVRLEANSFFIGVVGLYDVEELVQEALPIPYPFDDVPLSIDGHYKHSSGTPQTFGAGTCTRQGPLAQETTFTGGFAVYAVMTKWNSDESKRDTVAHTYQVYDDAAEYTSFSAPIEVLQENTLPDSLIFVLSSCPEFISPNPIAIPGSVTFIDNVDFTFCDIDNAVSLNARTLSSNEENAESYQWIDCNNGNTPIAGATDRTFIPESNGDYAVMVTKGACSETSACTFVDINSCNSASTQTIEACFEYTWLGDTFFETGTYTATLPNSLGCDSLLTLNLTIDTVNTIVTQMDGTLTSLQPNATYQWLDCDNDNTPIDGATASTFTADISGKYAVEITTSKGCIQTTTCQEVDLILSIEENTFGHPVSVYPNPSNGSISIDLGESYSEVEIVVRDLLGNIQLTTIKKNMRQTSLELNVPPGIYWLSMTSKTGATATAQLIIN
ncbi:MAG: T9SS type A sorting domain-containing protein [Bacteroidota bacterium]